MAVVVALSSKQTASFAAPLLPAVPIAFAVAVPRPRAPAVADTVPLSAFPAVPLQLFAAVALLPFPVADFPAVALQLFAAVAGLPFSVAAFSISVSDGDRSAPS